MAIPEYLTLHQPLVADLREWSTALEADFTSQRIRRAYVHSALTYIQAACFGMKHGVADMHDELVAKGARPIFSLAEMAMLREVSARFNNNDVVAEPLMPRFRPNVRFALLSVKRAFGLAWDAPEGECWSNLDKAKNIRNNITHPKTADHLSVSDENLILVEGVAAWFGTTHESLVEALKSKVERTLRGEDTWPHRAP